MRRSRCRSWHLGKSRSVKREEGGWGEGGWVPVINTTVDGEDIVIGTCRSLLLGNQKGRGAEGSISYCQFLSFL